jgi:hypothetical protein
MKRKGISIQEASKLTGFAESTLQQACVHGEIKAHKEDLIHWTVDVDSLIKYAKEHHPIKRSKITTEKSVDINDIAKGTINKDDLPNITVGGIDGQPPEEIAESVTKKLRDAISRNEARLKFFDEYPTTNMMVFPKPKVERTHDFHDKVVSLTYSALQTYGDKRFKDGFIAGLNADKEEQE